jgi:ABC-type sugar transport system ATPase subunit
MASLGLRGIAKVYPNGHVALDGIDLDVGDGDCVVLVGPSGCGKSTLLRTIAGLESPTSGAVLLDGVDVTDVPPQGRDLAMVFQSYALYPHMSVRENLGYALRVRGSGRAQIEARIAEVAAALQLETLLDRRPAQLSGGQRQRVALGRAIVRAPKAFLLDEPLSNLDLGLRVQARAELQRLHRRLGATMVHVTHDQEEAMTLGSRVVVMRAGRIEQAAAPLDVYARPANTFVAQFIGSPAMNLVPAPLPGVDAPAGTIVGVRPPDLLLGDNGPLAAVVEVVEPRGHDSVVYLRLDAPGGPPLVALTTAPPPREGARLRAAFRGERVHLFDARTGVRI